MPKVYIIEDTAPNAFATGRDPKHASIAITTGLLQKLDREELQGVIGHELAHVRNLDIRFTLLVGVLVGSIALLADFFLRFTFWGGGRGAAATASGGGGAPAIIFIVAIVLAILAPIVARLVQLAVSRQREYLADATSVELTRNPSGSSGRWRRSPATRRCSRSPTAATQHLYFMNPIKKFEERSSSLFSTHPAIVDRINRLRAADRRAAARRARRPRARRARLSACRNPARRVDRLAKAPHPRLSGRRSSPPERRSEACSRSSRRTTPVQMGARPAPRRREPRRRVDARWRQSSDARHAPDAGTSSTPT